MAGGTLFGHLALKFGAHPENIATEALCYILDASAHARAALARLCAPLPVTVSPDLRYRSQAAGSGGTIPDLLGSDSTGTTRLLIEAKFWAGLTDNQPVGYLKRLPAGQGAVLLFVAPSVRFSTLWPELLRRCGDAGEALGLEESFDGAELRWASVSSDHVLALTSWRHLLTTLHTHVSSAGEALVAQEIAQILGLSDRMDADAFLPIRSEEFGAASPRRIVQLVRLIDDVTSVCVQKGLADTTKLRSSAGGTWYGRYLRLRGAGAFLALNFDHWAKLGETPFWIWVKDADWKSTPAVFEWLRPLERTMPSRVLTDPYWNCPLIPLFPPFAVERDQVVGELVRQIEKIGELIEPWTGGATSQAVPGELVLGPDVMTGEGLQTE